MTTRKAIYWTAGISFIGMVVGLTILLMFVNLRTRSGQERAGMLGQGMGLVCAIPIGVVWLKWASRVRREREERERRDRDGKQ